MGANARPEELEILAKAFKTEASLTKEQLKNIFYKEKEKYEQECVLPRPLNS